MDRKACGTSSMARRGSGGFPPSSSGAPACGSRPSSSRGSCPAVIATPAKAGGSNLQLSALQSGRWLELAASPSAPRNDDVLVRRVLFGALSLGGVDPPIEVVGEAREGLFEPCPVLARRLAFGLEQIGSASCREKVCQNESITVAA